MAKATTAKIDESFAYNVGKDIANLENEVEILKALPKGAEVLKIEVPKTDLTRYGKIRASVELPDSFKNSICLRVRFGSSFDVVTVLDSFEFALEGEVIYLIRLSSAEDIIKKTGVLNAEDVKLAEQQQQQQQQQQQRYKNQAIYQWLGKWLTDNYLADVRKVKSDAYVNFISLGDLMNTPFIDSNRMQINGWGDLDEVRKKMKDLKEDLESGLLNPFEHTDFSFSQPGASQL